MACDQTENRKEGVLINNKEYGKRIRRGWRLILKYVFLKKILKPSECV